MGRLGFFRLPASDASRVTTPDHADFAPPASTSTFDVRAEIALFDVAAQRTLLSQWSGSQRAFVFVVGADAWNRVRLYWSNDGTTLLAANGTTTIPGVVSGDRVQLRAVLTADNGASAYEVRFYYKLNSAEGITLDTGWSQLGTTITGGATTSIHNSTTEVAVGRYELGASDQSAGDIYQVAYKAAGVTKMFADFRSGTWEPTGTDLQGHTWTPQVNAEYINASAGASSAATKPGRWSVTPGMVAPEWRALWDKAEIVVPFWDPSDHPSEISASAGPMALGGSQLPTWTLTPYGWMAEFGTGGQGGWTTNASSKGMRTYDPFSWFGIARAGDLTGDEETIASTGTSDYVRFALTGNLSADAGGSIASANTTAGEISADDYVLWLWRCDGDAHFSLTGYNLTTGKYLTEDTATGSSDSGAAGPIRLGHRTTNDYGSRQLFFFSTRTFITDEMFAMLVRDPFGPLRMDPSGPEVWAAAGVTLDYFYPTSDINAVHWETAPTASQSLFAQVDEVTPSDTDYIYTVP